MRHIQPEDDVDQNSELDSTNLSQSTDNSVDVENTFELKVDSDAIANSNCITQYSSQELRERQEQESNLEPIIRWLSQDTEPIPHELYLMYVYKRGITTKTGSKALAPVWKGPFLVIYSNPPLCKIKDRKHRVFTIHHDRLKICKDRLLPIWLHRCRHDLLNLDSSVIYEDSDMSVLAGSQGQEDVPTLVMVPEGDIEQEDEAPLAEDARSDTLDSRDLDETLLYSQGSQSVILWKLLIWMKHYHMPMEFLVLI